MSKPPLGRLRPVPPRTYWADEARDFTPWLASEENVGLLGEAIGVEREVQDQEVRVGPFRADILCRSTLTDEFVLIENQLERTDHTHLGQLFTYAAGLDAATVVWIAAEFTEEHRAALDWLNRITHEDFRFFGVEVELWRIGDSRPAPRFNVVAKPNEWSKSVREARRGVITETGGLQIDYWSGFASFLEEADTRFAARAPSPRPNMDFALGRTGAILVAYVNTQDPHVAVALYLKGEDADDLYAYFYDRKAEVERELGFEAEWLAEPGRKSSKVLVRRPADPADRGTWPELYRWTLSKLEAFERVCGQDLRTLPRPYVAPEHDEGL